jgi:hypothetical protein
MSCVTAPAAEQPSSTSERVFALVVQHALAVADEDVLARGAHAHDQIEARNRRGTGAADRDLDVGELLARQLHAVEHGGGGDDGGAVLVVVEDGDLQPLLQLALDIKTLRRLDVFEVDAAERGLERGDHLDQLVGIELVQLDVEHVDAGELLEQAALAFHHRLAGERADVAQAQHRGAIRDHADEVAPRGVFGREFGLGFDREAGVGDTRRVGEREVSPVRQRLGRRDADLAAHRAAVVFKCGVAQRGFGRGEVLLLTHGSLL